MQLWWTEMDFTVATQLLVWSSTSRCPGLHFRCVKSRECHAGQGAKRKKNEQKQPSSHSLAVLLQL